MSKEDLEEIQIKIGKSTCADLVNGTIEISQFRRKVKRDVQKVERGIEKSLEHETIHIIIAKEESSLFSWLFDIIEYQTSCIRKKEIPTLFLFERKDLAGSKGAKKLKLKRFIDVEFGKNLNIRLKQYHKILESQNKLIWLKGLWNEVGMGKEENSYPQSSIEDKPMPKKENGKQKQKKIVKPRKKSSASKKNQRKVLETSKPKKKVVKKQKGGNRMEIFDKWRDLELKRREAVTESFNQRKKSKLLHNWFKGQAKGFGFSASLLRARKTDSVANIEHERDSVQEAQWKVRKQDVLLSKYLEGQESALNEALSLLK